jgi:hypothetical protein
MFRYLRAFFVVVTIIGSSLSAVRGGPALPLDHTGLNMPSGLAFHDSSLYVAEVSRITRYDDIESQLKNSKPVVISDQLPQETQHGWKFIAICRGRRPLPPTIVPPVLAARHPTHRIRL